MPRIQELLPLGHFCLFFYLLRWNNLPQKDSCVLEGWSGHAEGFCVTTCKILHEYDWSGIKVTFQTKHVQNFAGPGIKRFFCFFSCSKEHVTVHTGDKIVVALIGSSRSEFGHQGLTGCTCDSSRKKPRYVSNDWTQNATAHTTNNPKNLFFFKSRYVHFWY